MRALRQDCTTENGSRGQSDGYVLGGGFLLPDRANAWELLVAP
jgi:hypothetical protein